MTGVAGTRVIGFDGSDVFRYLLTCRDEILLNSVDVGVRSQVKHAMEVIQHLRRHREDQVGGEINPTGLLLQRSQQN